MFIRGRNVMRRFNAGGAVEGRLLLLVLGAALALTGTLLIPAQQAAAAPASTANAIPGSNGGQPGVEVVCASAGFACAGAGYNGTADQAGGNGWASWQYWQHGSNYNTKQKHNCTTYAAYRLQQNGYGYPGWTADANEWDTEAASRGVPVDQTPAAGAIAQWNGGAKGHVAYVEVATSTYVDITSDNYGGGTNRVRIYHSSPYRPDNYIHFKDDAVNPGWVHYPGWARETAIATIPGGWEMFHIGSDNRIYRKVIGTTDWKVIPGPYARKLAVTTSTDGRVELFYIGMNNQVYHHWESSPGGDISGWQALGGWATDIAAARGGNTWEVFVIGGDGSIQRARQVNHAWQRFAGTWASSVAAATSRDNRVELFHVGGGGNVFHSWQSSPGGSFGGWANRGGVKSDIGASSVGNGEWELYGIGGSQTIWRIAPWTGINHWQQLAGSASQISAARHPDGRVEVLVVGGNNNVYHAWQKAIGWF